MNTVFDWITLIIFSGLIVLFLQRSSEESPRDHMWQYLIAAVGCAVANYLGNDVGMIWAMLVIAADLAFIIFILKPLDGFIKK